MHLDDRVTIATPEGVTIELVLAGLGSRFIARLLDTVIQLSIIFALAAGLAITSPPAFVLFSAAWNDRQGDAAVHGFVSSPLTDTTAILSLRDPVAVRHGLW